MSTYPYISRDIYSYHWYISLYQLDINTFKILVVYFIPIWISCSPRSTTYTFGCTFDFIYFSSHKSFIQIMLGLTRIFVVYPSAVLSPIFFFKIQTFSEQFWNLKIFIGNNNIMSASKYIQKLMFQPLRG